MTLHNILVTGRSLGNTAEGEEGRTSFPLTAALTWIQTPDTLTYPAVFCFSVSLPLTQTISSFL